MSGVAFVCGECGREVFRVGPRAVDPYALCLHCTAIPGWFRDAELRRILDPDHDGSEPLLDTVAPWPGTPSMGRAP